MEGDDDIAKISRTMIGMDRERDFIQSPNMNGKPVKTEVTWSEARRPMTSRAAAFWRC